MLRNIVLLHLDSKYTHIFSGSHAGEKEKHRIDNIPSSSYDIK